VCRFGQTSVLCLILLLLSGCDSQLDQFDSNQVFSLTLAKSEDVDMAAAQADVSEVLKNLFGTPEVPAWPNGLLPDSGLVDISHLRRAAGSVSSEQDGTHLGLFREHCVVCHGVVGNGSGPASQFQNPYPRDFRSGVFKWKLSERSLKPSKDDLRSLLIRGVPGTGMPSFSLLGPEEIDALVDYVIYLSIRGEVERRLLVEAVTRIGYGIDELPLEERLIDPKNEVAQELIVTTLQRVVQQWSEADLLGPARSEIENFVDTHESVARGRALFHGKVANCVGCHGADGAGGVETLDYDDWTKEYTTKLGISPRDSEALRLFLAAGAHAPRQIHPRKLLGATLRGGDEPQRLFQLITQGIAGTPMPGVALVAEDNGKGLTESQVWDLVSYVRSLKQN